MGATLTATFWPVFMAYLAIYRMRVYGVTGKLLRYWLHNERKNGKGNGRYAFRKWLWLSEGLFRLKSGNICSVSFVFIKYFIALNAE